MVKVLTAEALAGYKLDVRFSDGTRGVVDFRPFIKREPFRRLVVEKAFRRAVVEYGAVEWPESEVGIATEALYAAAHGMKKPTTRAEADRNELEVSLREMRKVLDLTQTEVAEESGLTQGAISQFESAADHKVSALRSYLGNLGCSLELVAVKGDRRFTLRGV
jgi:DNA-binding XRE family transcriptional regulator